MNSLKPSEYMTVNLNSFFNAELNVDFLHLIITLLFFVSQLMIFFLSMTMRKTTVTGLTALEKSISIKSTLKLRDWQRRLLDGKEKRPNKSESRKSRKSKTTRSCMRGCRGSTKSIWHEQHVKRKRLDLVRSAGTRRDVQPLFMLVLQPAPQS